MHENPAANSGSSAAEEDCSVSFKALDESLHGVRAVPDCQRVQKWHTQKFELPVDAFASHYATSSRPLLWLILGRLEAVEIDRGEASRRGTVGSQVRAAKVTC